MDGPSYTRWREGCTLVARLDRGGNFAIGWGHNSPAITAATVWTQDQADGQFAIDYALARENASQVLGSGYLGLDMVRKAALVDMAYELGRAGLAQFRHMLSALSQGEWCLAAEACLASAYAAEVPARAAGAAHMLSTGQWPPDVSAAG